VAPIGKSMWFNPERDHERSRRESWTQPGSPRLIAASIRRKSWAVQGANLDEVVKRTAYVQVGGIGKATNDDGARLRLLKVLLERVARDEFLREVAHRDVSLVEGEQSAAVVGHARF